jgi:hypothetical protein
LADALFGDMDDDAVGLTDLQIDEWKSSRREDDDHTDADALDLWATRAHESALSSGPLAHPDWTSGGALLSLAAVLS